MKRFALTTLGVLALASSGCAAAGLGGDRPPPGLFYSGVKGIAFPTEAQVTDGVRPGPKQGQACTSGVLGFAAWGDMSLDAAKKAGGITRVDTIDFSQFAILGLAYVKNCIVITGE